MTARLDRAADEATARWLCHGCGATYPITGPSYPICTSCGQRCRMVDADGLPFVGSPEERLSKAQAEAEKAYAEWRARPKWLRVELDRFPSDSELERFGDGVRPHWRFLVGHAPYMNHTAEHLDRVVAEVARLEEP